MGRMAGDDWWRRSPALSVKRAIDLVGASLLLTATAPILLVAAAAIAPSGPVLFRQERPGYRGRLFTIVKFRTMREPSSGEDRYRTDAQRVTRLGDFLRRSSIDELPELFNVLTGDMSLVGPRPLLAEYLEKYTPEERRRHETPPGITGWAQVNGRQEIPFSERLRLDVWYVDNWSLWLDLRILMKTFAAIVLTPHGSVESAGLDAVDDLGLSHDRKRL